MTAIAQAPALGCVVLAAGLSRRMGGEHKLLKAWRGRPLLDHALVAASASGLSAIVVVTGARGNEVADLASRRGLPAVHNAEFAEGMGSSIAAGVRALPPGLAGAFIALGDMPLVRPDDYVALAAAFDAADPAIICAPAHGGRRGHPVLFGRAHFEALAGLRGDAGAASIVKAAWRVVLVERPTNGVLADFDTPDSFEQHPMT
ncbi:MAG: nucleotidyltransferase family protein [Hyphomicrobiales bacterium]|nr:nucleotidyltransferase family protein [Hyphomicrobiales bacterium]